MTDHTSKTAIPTGQASRYLQQLCKHFAHKLAVTFDEQAGQISFSIGDCRLKAEGSALHIDLTAPSAADMEQLKDVMIRHLVRFAFREELSVEWQDG
jgi:hypothetical protein